MPSQLTGVRLNAVLARRIRNAARRAGKSETWIVHLAIEEYLAKINQTSLAEEIRCESERIAKGETEDERAWLDYNERNIALGR